VTTGGVASCVETLACPTGGGCLFLDCDGPEDCEANEICRYSVAESPRYVCSPYFGGDGLACTTADDCPTAYPVCRNVGTNVAGLGWQPRYCSI
jgi:hypothetical protein